MPWGWDAIPGINIGNLFKQVTTGQDQDVLDGYTNSNRKGQMQIGWLPDPGVKTSSGTSGSNNNPQNESGGNTPQNGVTYDGASATGSAAASDARERANTVGMLDSEIEAIMRSLGNLDNTWNAGKTQIQDGFNKNLSRLNEQQSNALTKYATQRSDTKQNFNRSTEDVDNQAYNNFSALQALLGRSGAGSSSAAQNVVPYAVSQTASKARGGIADNFGKNLRDLTTAEDETKQSYNNTVKDLEDQRNTSFGSLENDVQSKRSAYEGQRANLIGQKTQAQGGDWQAVKNSMSGAVANRDSIDQALSTLLDRYRNPYTVQDVAVKDPTLANYAVDANGVKVDDPNGPGYDTDTSSDYMTRLKEEEKRKQAGLAVA